MATAMQERDGGTSISEKPPQDGRLIVKWIEVQSDISHARYARERLDSLLLNAAQPWHSSKNACNELCYFVEQGINSQSSFIREVVFSKDTALKLFNFYIEWNDKSQNRQGKQVLDLVASLLCRQPEEKLIVSIKESILCRLVSIITHQAAQPLVKPAFKALDLFLNKRVFSPQEVIEAYGESISPGSSAYLPGSDGLVSWDLFISAIFDWMALPDISPAAGKCLVTLFGQVKSTSDNHILDTTMMWQRWIRNGLDKDPSALENVKNYLFPPLFKFDRSGSILFLEDLNKQKPLSELKTMRELNAHSLLQLAAMEAGKKAGLVEEPNTIEPYKTAKKNSTVVVLQEDVIGELATCEVDTVRSLAFSVLVASPSPLRPFSVMALDILQSQMEILYADTDAKFRTDTLSCTRKMIERLRGTTAHLNKELRSLSFKLGLDPSKIPQGTHDLYHQTSKLLHRHEEFIEWYMEFLLGELVPTVSYQRHITALKAIGLLLRSGILHCSSSQSLANSNNAIAWHYNIDFFTARAMRLLLDLLMDPFEDVRSSAAAVLKLASIENFVFEPAAQGSDYYKPKLLRSNNHSSILDHQISERETALEHETQAEKGFQCLTAFIALAEDLAKRTGRADYADGVARCYELLYTLSSSESRLELVENIVHALEAKIHIAEQDLVQAVHNAPVHGTFAALNLIWDAIDFTADSRVSQSQGRIAPVKKWEQLQVLMLSLCSRIWKEVKDVLCNDSPEGHLPQGLDDIKAVDTKDVLSYSFRAIHDSSNLMRSMASKTKLTRQDGSTIIPLEVFKGIGELTFEQLSTLRHRGAFSTVALTFARCCQLTQTKQAFDEVLSSDLLEKWYQGTLQCIFQQASTTRRSAGIPTLMTSILSANSNRPAFNDVMMELASLARRPVELSEKDETNLPQVHAMNCLKEIFKSSALGKKAEAHIAECLQLAADSLSSEIWAIRNCGLLLLRSLMDCLFGTSESKTVTEAGWDGRSTRLSYDRYPSLPELLLKLLDTSTINSEVLIAPNIGAVESVFPALDIIRRAGPPPTHRDEVFTIVAKHLGSLIWHVREIAARTICTLLLHEDWLLAVIALIESSQQSRNRTHGVLLTVKFILERRLELDSGSATDGLLSIVSTLKKLKASEVSRIPHPEILAAHLELDNTIAKIILSQSTSESETDSTQAMQVVVSLIFADNVVEEFALYQAKYLRMSAETPGIASLCNAIIRRGVYTAAFSDDVIALQKILGNIAIYNTDIVLAALDCLPIAWKGHTSLKSLSGLSRAYMNLLSASTNPEVCACICYELADVLDRAFTSMDVSDPTAISSLGQSVVLNDISKELGSLLQCNDSPSFSNAQIRISGFLVVQEHVSKEHSNVPQEEYRLQLKAWGRLLWQSGKASNDFDTRHAAAAALHSFYNRLRITPHLLDDESALYPLLALYDTLNDDDDEIRDLSALTVSRLLQKSVVPLAARVELLKYSKRLYGSSPLFAWNVVCRVTGNDLHASETESPVFETAQVQFSRALKDDDSLFVEEEQNLFIDEVRETHLWAHAIEENDLSSTLQTNIGMAWAQPCAVLVSWVTDGLATMTDLLDKEDGPLEWTSRPAVFAVCMRVLLSAKAITRFNERRLASGTSIQDPSIAMAGVPSALERFTQSGREKNIHGSLLLGV